MEFVLRIEFGFGTVQTKWDGRLYLQKGRIVRSIGTGFERSPSDSFNPVTCSWKCTIPGRDSEYERRFEELLQKSGEHGHYFHDAIDVQDKCAPSSLTVWCDAEQNDVLTFETVNGKADFKLSNLMGKREIVVTADKNSSRIRAAIIKPDVARTMHTENVVLAIIDGIRWEDSFGENGWTLIPNIWNNLRPLGTVYNNFYCDGFTITVQAHGSMLTGKWQNHLGNSGEIRPNRPTIFEYHKMIETPSNPINHDPTRSILIAGKGRISKMNYGDFTGEPVLEYGSYHASYYGPKFGATVYAPADFEKFPSEESRETTIKSVAHSTFSDAATWAITQRVMKEACPSLLVINFGELDEIAHAGVRWIYDNSIRRLDTIMMRLWETIESEEAYRGRTTLIITTDHGRHNLENGGFQHHGCQCEGCKRCIFLAIGPDIRPNHVATGRHTLIDIAPTIGKMLGFATPYAEGIVMEEMFK